MDYYGRPVPMRQRPPVPIGRERRIPPAFPSVPNYPSQPPMRPPRRPVPMGYERRIPPAFPSVPGYGRAQRY